MQLGGAQRQRKASVPRGAIQDVVLDFGEDLRELLRLLWWVVGRWQSSVHKYGESTAPHCAMDSGWPGPVVAAEKCSGGHVNTAVPGIVLLGEAKLCIVSSRRLSK